MSPASGAGAHLNRTVGNWRLDRLLGEGGFGAVYAAQNVVVQGRRAAVKVLHAEMAVNADIKRRFINEASAASRADHENIIQVYDAGVSDDGTCYIVMELLAGRSLADLLRLGAIAPARAINIGVQVASALEAAHHIDIVHRDLKPDNIFLLSRASVADFVKVLDFGVAKLRDLDGSQATKTGTIIGTPGYMSPEQWKGVSDLDARADVYALGMILFECVVGRLPFSCGATYEWLYAHLNEPVPDVSILQPDCPPGLAQAITAMVHKEREQRPQSMTRVIELLRAAATVSPAERATVLAPEAGGIANLKTVVPQPARAATPLPGPNGTAVLSDAAAAAADAAQARAPSAARSPTPAPASAAQSGAAQMASGAAQMASGAGELHARTPPPRSTSPWPLVVIAAGVLLGVGGFMLFRPRHATTRTPDPHLSTVTPTPAPPEPPAPAPPPQPPEGMVAFGSGTLHMGRDDYGMPAALDVPAHDVKVGAFALARAEVTQHDFADFVAHGDAPAAANAAKLARELERHGALPVANVSHDDAARYCAKTFPKGRLPTEAEWEWAARGKEGRLYPWGNSLDKACFNGLAGDKGAPTDASKHPCGATPEGLRDLAGNVWEWTATPASAYPGAMVSAPPGEYFVVRGGSFYNMDPNELTATARQFVSAPNRYLGFRCASDL